jgi:adenosylmethionine-8-amino-7-oxononanoate aminotransferase
MPPFCITDAQLRQAVAAIRHAIAKVYDRNLADFELANT